MRGIHAFSGFHPQALAVFADRTYEASRHLPRFLEAIGVSNGRFCTVRQVHGDRVILADRGAGCSAEEADGLITREKNLALVIRTADCVPLFLMDPKIPAAGLSHVGWRGAQKGIVGRTVERLIDDLDAQPKRFNAALGPHICEKCYEVGPEFESYFPGFVARRDQKFFFDLGGWIKKELESRGIPEASIIDAGFCTFCSGTDFFSARREGAETGRLLSAIMLKDEK